MTRNETEDRGKRVILIDDDPDFHTAIRMILEPEGYQIAGHLTGPDGLAALRRDPCDIVLLDIMLSSPLEGFYLMDEIRKDPELKDLPVLMISAIGETMGSDYAREMGTGLLEADLFLEKPIESATLRQAVREVLQRPRKHR